MEVDDNPNDDPTGFVEQSFIDWGTAPLLYVPPTRINLPAQSLFDGSIATAAEIPPDDPGMDRLFDPRSNVFYGRAIEIALKPDDDADKDFLREVFTVGYSCAQDICPEVLRGSAPQFFSGTRAGTRVDLPGLGILISDNFFDPPLYAGALSSGTQGILLWIWALALRLGSHYGGNNQWKKRPAILLIDEIENHLHPTWQRRVIPALLKHFQGLQIFATTHSPFVVAGLKAGQVHLLKRNEDGVVTASTNTEDVIGWTADEILRTMMDVDDPTDDATADAAKELRQLRQEPQRATLEEEEQRQERISELRQKVDRDLLAGGPMARQREIFEERFASVMQKYRESQDLN